MNLKKKTLLSTCKKGSVQVRGRTPKILSYPVSWEDKV